MDREIPKSEIARRKRIMWIRGGIVAAVAVVAVGAMLLGLRKSVKASDLKFSEVERGSIETSVSASGKVAPAFEEIINSPIATRVVEVFCKSGDSVGEGTPLLRLDLQSAETELDKLADELRIKSLNVEQTRLNIATYLKDLDMKVKVKEMNVNRLKAEVENEKRLDSLGSGTGDKVREAEFAYNTARLELTQLRQQLENERSVKKAEAERAELELSIFRKNVTEQQRTLEDAQIRSPRAATLTYINNEVGSRVSQGEKVAVISDLSHFRVDAEIADSYGERVAPGARVDVKIGREVLGGTVASVNPLSHNGVITFTVRLDDDDHARLRSGLRTDVYVMCDVKDDIMRIRNGSYYMGPGGYDMFVDAGDGVLTRRNVSLGESNYEWVEVKSGLNPGDKVVISDMNDFKKQKTIKLK